MPYLRPVLFCLHGKGFQTFYLVCAYTLKAPVIILSLSPFRCPAPPGQLEQGLETENDPDVMWPPVHRFCPRLEPGVQLALCTAALLPELKPAPCFLSAIIGQID